MSVEVHTLIGAYVLDALPADERAHFERHLTECDVCGAEVTELLGVAARLGISAVEPAPPTLRRRVLDAIDVTRPLSPRTDLQGPRSWGRQIALVAAAAGLVAVGGLGARLADRPEPVIDAVAGQVLAAADVRTVVLDSDRGVQATLHWSPALDEGVLIASGLPMPDDAEVYQVWAHSEGEPRRAGSFDASTSTTVSQVVQDLRGVEQIAVTLEPEEGAVAPTGPVVLQGALS